MDIGAWIKPYLAIAAAHARPAAPVPRAEVLTRLATWLHVPQPRPPRIDAEGAAARQALVRLTLSPQQWSAVDPRWRRAIAVAQRENVAPSTVAGVAKHGAQAATWLRLSACHPDGAVREAALAALATRDADAQTLALFLLRLNDWVPLIRQAAHAALVCVLDAAPATAWVEQLPLIAWLKSAGRVGRAVAVERILQRLREADAQAALLQRADAWDRATRRFALGLVVEYSPERLDPLGYIEDPDPHVRLMILRAYRGDRVRYARDYPRWQRSRSGRVRQSALRKLIEWTDAQCRPQILEALDADRAGIRALAAHWLRKSDPGFDLAGHYRAGLNDLELRRVEVALLALGECGDATDAVHLLALTTSPSAKLRSAALRALWRLDPQAHAGILLDALADPSAAVARCVVRLLWKRPQLVPIRSWAETRVPLDTPLAGRIDALARRCEASM